MYLYVVGTMPKCPPMGGVHLQEVSVSGGSTVLPARASTWTIRSGVQCAKLNDNIIMSPCHSEFLILFYLT